MNSSVIRFDSSQLNLLSAAYILLDSKYRILALGSDLQSLFPNKKSVHFSDYFSLNEPTVVHPNTSETNLPFPLQEELTLLTNTDSQTVVKGKFIKTNQQYLFLGNIVTTKSIVPFATPDNAITIVSKRLENVIQHIQSGILVEDEFRKIVLTNQLFCDLFSIQALPEQLKGFDCSQSAETNKIFFKNPEGFVSRINEILQKNESVVNDILELIDGRIFSRDYSPLLIDGKKRGHLWTYNDITLAQQAQKALINREEKYRGIISNMNLGLMEVDLNETILFANASFCKMSGYSLHELIGKKTYNLFVPIKAFAIEATIARRKKGLSDAYPLNFLDRNQEEKWWLISGAPLLNDAGVMIGSIGIHLDITHQKEIEKELIIAKERAEDSSRAKEEFLANMSHEIRTPLNAIIGMANQLTKSKLSKQQQFYLDNMLNASENLLVVINDILDISKIEAGKLSIERIPFNLNELNQKVTNVNTLRAEEKGLYLKFQIDPNIHEFVIGDPHRLNQVLMNLIGNAIKFTEKGGITLRCKAKEFIQPNKQVIAFEVSDTGIGMDKNYLNGIFEKFSQEDKSISRKYGGTGLGLSICKALVELMGGTITIKSKKKKGTTIIVNLPFEKTQLEEVAPAIAIKTPLSLEGVKLLLVEDNELNRLVATSILNEYGAVITEAVNGKEALQKLNKESYDLILMDLSMPIMNGYEATLAIRNKLRIKTPIIALTANAIRGERKKCMEAGMNNYLSKPFKEQELVYLIQQTIHKSAAPKKVKIATAPVSENKMALGNQPLYSFNTIAKIAKGNMAFMQKIRALLLTQMPAGQQELEQAIMQENYETVYAVAHRLKSNATNLEINSLKELMLTIEVLAHSKKEWKKINTLFAEAKPILEAVVEQLRNDTSFNSF